MKAQRVKESVSKSMPRNKTIAGLYVLSMAGNCQSFVLSQRRVTHYQSNHDLSRDCTSIALYAKKATKPNKKQQVSSGGGGFGSLKKSVVVDANDDFAIFPALEHNVMQTLIPADQPEAVGELPNDIYQRLKHIYGFPSFNYLTTTTEEEGDDTNYMDLLTTPETSLDTSTLLENQPTLNLSWLESDTNNLQSSKLSPVKDISNSLNYLPAFEKMSVLHVDPLVLSIQDFFTNDECDRYISMVDTSTVLKSRSPTVGKDQYSKSQRTSTTWYNEYKTVPELLSKACRLLGLSDIHHWEEPQTVRYKRTEKFTWHLDALGPAENQASLGGQRTATLLVYLTDLQESEGGATMFRDLGKDGMPLKVRPKKGSALLFFPAAKNKFDIRTLHAGEAVAATAENDKWISQMWLRDGIYQPSLGDHASAADAISEYCSTFA